MALEIKRWNHPLLTNVQNEIVPSLCDDCLSTKEVADKHCISVNTVASHKKSIFSTLNITKITELSKLFFTMVILPTILGLHGLLEDQNRNRRPFSESNEVIVNNRRNSRRKRRERDISRLNFMDVKTI